MRFDELSLRIPGDELRMRFHERLTVLSGIGALERQGLVEGLLGIGNSGAHANIVKWGGYVGLATAAAAWYASFAGVTNATFKRTVLPVFPLMR